jgi:hypothetical protein
MWAIREIMASRMRLKTGEDGVDKIGGLFFGMTERFIP